MGIAYQCAETYDFAGNNHKVFERAIQHVANLNKYDPLREYVDTLPAWDGVGRLHS